MAHIVRVIAASQQNVLCSPPAAPFLFDRTNSRHTARTQFSNVFVASRVLRARTFNIAPSLPLCVCLSLAFHIMLLQLQHRHHISLQPDMPILSIESQVYRLWSMQYPIPSSPRMSQSLCVPKCLSVFIIILVFCVLSVDMVWSKLPACERALSSTARSMRSTLSFSFRSISFDAWNMECVA